MDQTGIWHPQRLLRLALGLMLLFASTSLALAQSTGSATLRGTVKDPQGALVEDASVILINEATKDERKAKTNDSGIFVFSSVNPGIYTVKVESTGFKTSEQTGLVLSPGDTRGLDVTLEVGAASETVTVTAEAERLQTETGAKEQTITAKQIDNLSIISRSSLELLRILPGVVAPEQSDLESISFGGGANRNEGYNVNGIRGVYNTVTIDGSRMMDIGSNNGTIITANPDMIQEVKVQSSNYAAEHGSSAIQISATTKSGSSAFHGEIFDYIRHHRFAANDRSNSINGVPKPKSQYNYPGGNIGGPVLIPGTNFNKNRDKLFFFAGFEYYYQRVDEGSSLSVVPTLRQRQGDFSELLTGPGSNLNQGRTVNVPGGCTVNGVGPGNPAPNNNLAPCIDPIGRALINLYPEPNFSDPNNRFNYVFSTLRPTDRYQFVSRIDYNISDNTKLYVRLAREHEEQTWPRGFWWNSSAYAIPGDLSSDNLGRSVAVNLTHVFNPTMTNEILFSGSKLKLDNDFKDPSKVTYEALGIQPFGFFPNSNPYVPIGIIDGWGSGIGGDLLTAYGYPLFAYNDSFSINDNLTKVYNSHTFKFGAFIEQANKKQNFNSDIFIELAQWGQPNGTGNNYGDLLVGRPINVSMGTDVGTGNFRYYNYEFYAQDNWKVRPNFSLEYGVRIAYLPLNFERNAKGVVFDPRVYDPSQGLFINGDLTRPNGVLTAARGEIPKGLTENPPISWMPRLNFAWDIGGKGDLVVRAGAGLFYNRVQGNYEYYSLQQMPNAYRASAGHWAQEGGLTFGGLRNIDPFSSIANVDFTSRNPDSIAHPRVANMSLTIEKKLWFDNIFTVAYVGTQARHLPQNRYINIIEPGELLSGTVGNSDLSNPLHRAALETAALKTFRPFPAYNNITFNEFAGTSSYHSLQATLSRRAGQSLEYFATYTFSKALGTTAVGETGTRVDPVDTRGRSYGILPFDRTHIFNISYNYYFPKLARGFLDNPVG
ncbi:MAG TPA: carboxypeptidase regulatory-like domain-containing protein, partial [Blastocatellia bacterium]|nr:carboxypeptidase regulatory-like domain-containing protein [Blastocatellia bacterium]